MMEYSLWQCLNMWRWLYIKACKKDFQCMVEIARRMEGWNPCEFSWRIERNPIRILISFDGLSEITVTKKELHEMFAQPIVMLRWVRKNSYQKS